MNVLLTLGFLTAAVAILGFVLIVLGVRRSTRRDPMAGSRLGFVGFVLCLFGAGGGAVVGLLVLWVSTR